jgi:N-acetyl-gamma-glutamylphosphate reductase
MSGTSLPRINVAILGASGYIGGEALRLLVGHPYVNVVAVTAA